MSSNSVPDNAALTLIERFNAAFNEQDIEAVMGLMTDDCVFENTYPPPDGARAVGQAAVRAAFVEFFNSSPGARFETERTLVGAEHVVVNWCYRWRNAAGDGHVRGVDVFTLRDGKIAEKLAYVKG
jgi:ketosteroid isomerase-like protein